MAYDDAGNFQNSASAVLAAGPLNDVDRLLIPGYSSGSTKRLFLTPAAGNTTINGLSAVQASDGKTILIVNLSATDYLVFNHQAAGSSPNNRFSNQNAGQVAISPLGAARCTYNFPSIFTNGFWQFA